MIATSEDVKKESDRFIKDLSDKMQTLDKAVCRGIMAQVLHELPVFLRNSQEILDYIQMTLIDCSDPREKLVTMDLLQQLMDEQ